MQRGRRIAFDYGDVRIGVAISDPDAILASPLTTLRAVDKKLDSHLLEIFSEYLPIHIYVGRPAHMDGRHSQSATKAAEFANHIATLVQCPVELIDERLSTVTAARNLRESGVKSENSRDKIDQAAAVAILEFAMSMEKRKP